jgi:hypothetical protein
MLLAGGGGGGASASASASAGRAASPPPVTPATAATNGDAGEDADANADEDEEDDEDEEEEDPDDDNDEEEEQDEEDDQAGPQGELGALQAALSPRGRHGRTGPPRVLLRSPAPAPAPAAPAAATPRAVAPPLVHVQVDQAHEASSETMLTLAVGGHTFRLPLACVLARPETMLGRMFGGDARAHGLAPYVRASLPLASQGADASAGRRQMGGTSWRCPCGPRCWRSCCRTTSVTS